MGASARPIIEAALDQSGVETMLSIGVAAIDERAVTTSSGSVLAAATVVWSAGMQPAR